MGKRLNFWPLAGFLTVSALGTLAHFAYEWSGKQLLAGAFCAVNESTWEHMKLLFFPALLFTMIQIAAARERDGAIPAVRAVSITAGLLLIPVLYYTYTGALGRGFLAADIGIFLLSAAAAFLLDRVLRRRGALGDGWQQILGLLLLWGVMFLFVYCSFRPGHIPLFRDPGTGGYGIPK